MINEKTCTLCSNNKDKIIQKTQERLEKEV